jgi:putative DNA primase/helicase
MSEIISIDNQLTQEIENENKLHTRCAESIMKDHTFRTLRDTKEILYYENGVYRQNGGILIEEECQKRVRNSNTRLCNEVINTIRRSTYTDRSKFESIPNLVNLKNGIYDIENDVLLSHSPKYLFRIQHPIEYKKGVSSEEFIKFLETCLIDQKDRVTILEEMASIFLYNMKFEKAFLHEGIGSNGKSTCFHVLDSLAGEENTSHVSIHELAENRFASSRLDGKCLNSCAEISDDELKQTRKLKSLISGDTIEAEKKGVQMFPMKNFAKMFFAANKLPEINKFGEAELRRFIVTRWNQKFKSNPTQEELDNGIIKSDIELNVKLTTPENLSGIFNLIIIHAKKLIHQKRFSYEQSVEQLQREWKEKEDTIETFATLHLKPVNGNEVAKSVVFGQYEIWCNENKIIPKSQREFNSRIKNFLRLDDTRSKINGKTTVVWSNLQINNLVTELLKLPILLTGIKEKENDKNDQ